MASFGGVPTEIPLEVFLIPDFFDGIPGFRRFTAAKFVPFPAGTGGL